MNLMQRRRALMGAAKSNARIPAAYQEVEWVGTNGKKTSAGTTLNIGYVVKVAPRVVMKAMQLDDGNFSIFLGTDNVQPRNFQMYGAMKYYKWGNSNNTAGLGTAILNTWLEIDAGERLYVDGVLKATKSGGDFSENTHEFIIFGGTNHNYNTRFAYFKLYDGDALVRDLVPCYRKSDERIGFYDLVGGQFYTNAGDADLWAKGADI